MASISLNELPGMTAGTTSIRVEQAEETPVEDVKVPVAAADPGSAGAMTTTDGVELRFMISSSAVEAGAANWRSEVMPA